jgi:hypothetical protein
VAQIESEYERVKAALQIERQQAFWGFCSSIK